ncbi:MAG: LamG domain-containing protein [Verrucomicrobiota bacterium]
MKSPLHMTTRALLLSSACWCCGPLLHASLLYNLTFEKAALPSWANSGTVGGMASAVESGYRIAPAPVGDNTKVYSGSWSGSFVPAASGNASYAGVLLLPESMARFKMDAPAARMTISTWLYWQGEVDGNNRYGIVNTLNASQTTGWAFYLEGEGRLAYNFIQASSGHGRVRVTDPVIKPGQWTHVALTWDASVKDSRAILIYVNGVLQPTAGASLVDAVAVPGVDPDLQPLDVAVGSVSHMPGAGGSFSLNGNLDDFAMWDTVLSAAEIRAINTASALFPTCTASVMEQLFNAYKTKGSHRLGSLVWSRANGFATADRSLGDMWQESDGRLYIWLEGEGSNASGLMGVRAGS